MNDSVSHKMLKMNAANQMHLPLNDECGLISVTRCALDFNYKIRDKKKTLNI